MKENKVNIDKLIKELSREEFGRKPVKVFETKKRQNKRLSTREILETEEEDE